MDRLHVGIIMDGNGRWALGRGLPRVAGHRAGAAAVRRVIEAAPDLGIRTLTLYAFSEDNWSRPAREVTALMKLLGRYLVEETDRCVKNGVRLEAIGRRDRLPAPLVALIEDAECRTARCRRLNLFLAPGHFGNRAATGKLRHRRIVFRGAGSGRGFADPNVRRAALERFSAVGMCLCRDGVHAADVAYLHRRRPGRRRG